ncbi:MAG: GNAT family N-acetyltransferase, partial [Fimbriimonadaceae bacterium]|nr:GNAT family N-acetyltransferase [Alphaproteobacteria bacterium]
LGERMVMFDALVQQKSAWFKAHRIDDLFACESKLAFLRHLATQKQVVGDQWTLLSGLELNGEWISVNLGVVHREHYAGLILSIADSEAKRFSPGHLLITKTMQHCSDNGIRNFSFGAGDNDLKTKWSAENRSLTLATMPLTLRGRVYETFLQNANRVKSSVKSNAFLWRQFKHLRGLSAK